MNTNASASHGFTRLARWVVPLITGLVLALLAFAPGVARAAETDEDSPPPANSFRYVDGTLVSTASTDVAVAAADVPQTIAGNTYARFTRSGSGWEATLDGKRLTVTNASYYGVDVDESNGAIDWAKAKRAGVGFALIRCGVGTDRASLDDARWSANVMDAKAKDIPFGVTLYSYATNVNEAKSEADHVLRLLREQNLEPSDLEYPVFYDLEQATGGEVPNAAMLADVARTFCDAIEAAGYDAGVYASLNWWNNYLTDPVFDQWERWVAQWLTEGRESASTSYKGAYSLWQCLGNGYVDGIGRVDINFDYRQRCSVPTVDERDGAIYRLNNPYSGAHLFTPSTTESRALMLLGWTYEGRAWTAPTSGTAVYRLYNPHSTDHFYTSSRAEYDHLGAVGWNQEGVSFYTDATGTVPILRLFNPYVTVGTHHFTRDLYEYRSLASIGWVQEGIAFRGIDS